MRTTAKCQWCGNEFEVNEMVELSLVSRGKGVAYLCQHCANHEASYFASNDKKRGSANHGFSYGIEFETSFSTASFRVEMTAFDFLPTRDSSVDVEYKSPIYYSLKPLPKKLRTISDLIQAGEAEVDSSCGTHLNIGHTQYINEITINWIAKYYEQLFGALESEMVKNPWDTEQLFGRFFSRHYAHRFDGDTSNRYNWINVTKSHVIEFRLCKFVNDEQFMNCVHFCDDVVSAIIKNFIAHYYDEPTDTRRYKTQEQYREHKAKMTGEKLVKLFKKYTA